MSTSTIFASLVYVAMYSSINQGSHSSASIHLALELLVIFTFLVHNISFIGNRVNAQYYTYHRRRIQVVCRPQRHPGCPRSHHTQFRTSLQCKLLPCLSEVHPCHSSVHHWRFLPGSTHSLPQPATADHHQSTQLRRRQKWYNYYKNVQKYIILILRFLLVEVEILKPLYSVTFAFT